MTTVENKEADVCVIASLVDKIGLSYDTVHDLVPAKHTLLPNRDVIILILENFKKIIFPGYFGRKNFDSDCRCCQIGYLADDLHESLSEQIALALTHLPHEDQEKELGNERSENYRALGKPNPELIYKAKKLSLLCLEKIPEIRIKMASDVQAAYDGDPAASSKDEIIFSYPGIFAVLVYRLAHELYRLEVPLIPRIMSEYAHNITGIDIHPGAQIGNYFFIDHGTGVVIGGTTQIGQHVKIYQGVTLGALSTRGGQALRNVKRHPTIEDNVTIYSGASILGGETVIESDVVIGSNAFITKSIPKGTKVSVKIPELLLKKAEAKLQKKLNGDIKNKEETI